MIVKNWNLQNEGVLVVVNLFAAFGGKDYCYYIEAVRAVVDIMGSQEILCGVIQFLLLIAGYKGLGRSEVLVRAALDLDKDNRTVAIDHNQIDFTELAGKIAGQGMKAFAFQEFFGPFLTPFAKEFRIW